MKFEKKFNVLFIIRQCKSVYAMMLLSENEFKSKLFKVLYIIKQCKSV